MVVVKIENIIDYLKSCGFEHSMHYTSNKKSESRTRDYDIEHKFNLLDFNFIIWSCESIFSNGELYYDPRTDHYFNNIKDFDVRVFREDQLSLMLDEIVNSLEFVFRQHKDILRQFNLIKLGI